jgi:hypothetical protein
MSLVLPPFSLPEDELANGKRSNLHSTRTAASVACGSLGRYAPSGMPVNGDARPQQSVRVRER